MSISGNVGAADLRKIQWNDLEAEKQFWIGVQKNPEAWASKYDTDPGQVLKFAEHEKELIMKQKDALLPPSGNEPA